MDEKYEINRSTLAIIPIDSNQSQIIETMSTFIINRSARKIINENCRMYGSSYQGRYDGSTVLLGTKYKNPIIISEINGIIFFPTLSARDARCCWICSNHIETYEKKGAKTLIKFKNAADLIIDCSYYIIDNQVLKSALLENKLNKLKI